MLLCAGLPSVQGCSAIIDADTDRIPDAAMAPSGGTGGSGGSAGAGGSGGDPDASRGGAGGSGGAPAQCPEPSRCDGGTWTGCRDGEPFTYECPDACAEDGRWCEGFTPSNVPEALWNREATSLSLDADRDIDTSRCEMSDIATQIVEQKDADDLCVMQAHDFTVAEGVTIELRGSRPLVVMASGTARVDGVIDLAARGSEPGAGGGVGGGADDEPMSEASAEGPQPGSPGTFEYVQRGPTAFVTLASGGGGGGFCGAGGPGGDTDDVTGGEGGGVVDEGYALSPLRGGSGGGRGGDGSASGVAGPGGAGGGVLQISAREAIHLNGSIWATGGGGGGGEEGGLGNGAGGGGGSGGGVLLEAQLVAMAGAASILTTGGGGGSGYRDGDSSDGNDGAGRVEPAAGADGGVAGGRSGGGATPDAEGGMDPDTTSPQTGSAAAGGGGGGVGCIVVRQATGELPAAASRFSPSKGLGLQALSL